MAETDRYSGSKRVINIKILGGVPSFTKTCPAVKFHVHLLQLLSYVS